MSDEQHDHSSDPSTETPFFDGDPYPSSEWIDEDEFEDSPLPDDPDGTPQSVLDAVAINSAVLGVLTLHFRDRDIAFEADGYAAMRALANVKDGIEAWGDPLCPIVASAENLWLAVRSERILGASWVPVRSPRGGFAIDPQAA